MIYDTETVQSAVDFAAAMPERTNTEIYWDSQDPMNEGPAYRIGMAPHQESGPLTFAGWSTDDETDGYVLDAYFDGDGRYLGPDSDGVHPTFRTA